MNITIENKKQKDTFRFYEIRLRRGEKSCRERC